MLGSPWREIERVLRLPLLSRAGRSPVFGYLAARTRFYDEAIRSALGGGVAQVVIVAAGFDSRAWRLAAPGVRFFEIDLPATQALKRERAPGPGPVYVPVDLERDDLSNALRSAGHRIDHPTVFVAEGVLMYLSEQRVRAVLASCHSARAREACW